MMPLLTSSHTCICLLLLFLLVCSTCATPTLSSLATLTTLPPAHPTGSGLNDTDPCAFEDLDSLVTWVLKNPDSYDFTDAFYNRTSKTFDLAPENENLTILVTKCDGVCTLVYGNGNPDISGIGVS